MDLKHSVSTTITAFFLIIIIIIMMTALIYLSRSPSKKKSSPSLPPGPWKLPVIGNLHNLATGGQLPHRTLRELSRKHGPIMHLKLGEISVVVVSSPDTARQVMKTHDLSFAQRPQLLANKVAAYDDIDIAFAPYGEYWRQMRKVCALELLSNKRVRSFSRIREEEVSGLVESVRRSSELGSPPVNLTEKLFELMSRVTCRSAFGDKCKDLAGLVSVIKEGTLIAGGFSLVDLFPSVKFLQSVTGMRAKLEKIHVKLDKILEAVVDEHLRDSSEGEIEKEDLVHVLLNLQRSGSLEIPITTQHIKAVIFDIFAAGTDTAATVAEWAMAEMMKNPRVMKKAQAELRRVIGSGKKRVREKDIGKISYLKLVIKETLRLHPPAPLLVPRECREACSIEGHEIPTKTKVIVNAWAIGRDPEFWDDPERFLPERFDEYRGGDSYDYQGTRFEYIPFGAGRRMCPGISFGLAKVEHALAQLLYHFDWELPSGDVKAESLDMTEVFGVTVGRKQNLYLKAVPYN